LSVIHQNAVKQRADHTPKLKPGRHDAERAPDGSGGAALRTSMSRDG